MMHTLVANPCKPMTPLALRRGFSLIELLVCIAIVSILLSLMVPGLVAVRVYARRSQCATQLHQLGLAFVMYVNESGGRAMPLAYTDSRIIGDGPPIYWWGSQTTPQIDHTRGFVYPYLKSELAARSVFECPSQAWGSYEPQGNVQQPTSTYGYNGYYLSPRHTPGWSQTIGKRPWQILDRVSLPQRLFVFADTLIDMGDGRPMNNALLDPPQLFQKSGRWKANPNPTTAFRHAARANVALADGHVEAFGLDGGKYTSAECRIGAVGADNDPHYVPDWRDW